MELHVWLAFLVASCVIAVSPGSGAVLSMSHGLSYGVRRTTATIVGLQLGLAVILLVAGLGVGAVLTASATAFTVIKVVGACYLLWLGWRQWRAPVAPAASADGGEAAREPDLTAPQRVLRGFLTNVTNPKGIVFMAAVLPQFIQPTRPLWLQLLVLLATTVMVDVTVMHGYAWLAARLQGVLRSVRARRAQNRVFGGVLMTMGAFLFLFKRSA
ncbi:MULTISPECIES: homoserine/homoserine lactone efflux protein [Variovorax]|jgi:homoserine/homoserine lactone efflux protein|uniref:homoserine/homoserine lactone efflux protein n=1 Tax=Variovorax TaxID=34072 RepID=UPI00086C18F9|nr:MULTISPECIES: homoserine/homoserine lactone efflux protein [Variovorax]MBN8752724.1 homoserine/homoserine lactone efflux protein [Variovorax sp.]ODU16200.1 MAG: lysine transporter LysE [Variovorax sp. SCN 67-85]ODV25950.1 MAG: lysine transporter LysE [Variovorax sp. SCN 67-20]OJZ10314.1 MAG: lysine transporter LysE [Variovorax sp. 67-131]UKI06949.1 homoserine/homoserine lactone efflux protein [Variovorax paradoxus]